MEDVLAVTMKDVQMEATGNELSEVTKDALLQNLNEVTKNLLSKVTKDEPWDLMKDVSSGIVKDVPAEVVIKHVCRWRL